MCRRRFRPLGRSNKVWPWATCLLSIAKTDIFYPKAGKRMDNDFHIFPHVQQIIYLSFFTTDFRDQPGTEKSYAHDHGSDRGNQRIFSYPCSSSMQSRRKIVESNHQGHLLVTRD